MATTRTSSLVRHHLMMQALPLARHASTAYLYALARSLPGAGAARVRGPRHARAVMSSQGAGPHEASEPGDAAGSSRSEAEAVAARRLPKVVLAEPVEFENFAHATEDHEVSGDPVL